MDFVNWAYTESDPALMLFTAARERFGFDLPAGARVLELGCAETDFIERMKRQNPSLDLVGVDVRKDRDPQEWVFVQGDASYQEGAEALRSVALFRPRSFDAIVMLGALEHFGLGFYGDPLNDNGDTDAMRNVSRWLKPDGWCYFDVPYAPQGYRVAENRHFRHYDEPALSERLLVPGLREVARGYSHPEPTAGTWLERPACDRVPYWFVAVLCAKPE